LSEVSPVERSGRFVRRRPASKALVTGGAGFIGSNLARALLQRGDEVRVLDNFSTGYRRNLESLDVELVEGDLRSYERVATAVNGVEVVFHQGALPSVPRSIQDPLTSTAVNVEGTLNVLLAARDAGVRRIVFASSSSVYGNAPGMPRRESQPVAPLAPYAVSKLAAEQYCMVANRVFGVETVALRYFNVFGEYQDPRSGYAAVIPKFIRLMLDGERPTIFGDGETSRDFTHVENVVEANLAAAVEPAAAGRVMNVAIGRSHTLNDLVRTLRELLDSEIQPDYGPPRSGDVRESLADVSLARELIGYEPSVELEDGLERTIAWIVEQGASYEARSL
jgi:UDP-N-acetylglucosamine/UDP-N-acetyl-alpha-D-glucosaminouronate 4-epimerase